MSAVPSARDDRQHDQRLFADDECVHLRNDPDFIEPYPVLTAPGFPGDERDAVIERQAADLRSLRRRLTYAESDRAAWERYAAACLAALNARTMRLAEAVSLNRRLIAKADVLEQRAA